MPFISKNEALGKIEVFFAEWLKVSKGKIRKRPRFHGKEVDGFFKVGKYEFIIEFKIGSNSAQVASAINFLKSIRVQPQESLIPLVVVPFMGEVGRKL